MAEKLPVAVVGEPLEGKNSAISAVNVPAQREPTAPTLVSVMEAEAAP